MQHYPKHYCGVFGVYGHPNAAELTYYGLHGLPGQIAVGHTRYSTTGSSHLRNAQPLTGDSARGRIAVAHNGNLTNAGKLRDELEARGAIFQTTVDSEIVLHLMAQPCVNGHGDSLLQAIRRIEGAY